MASVLGNNLVDDLLPTVDELRSSLLPDFGVRQYRVKLVRRTWDGEERGDGDFSDVESEILPLPLVEIGAPPGGLHYSLTPQGREEEGAIKISEISLANFQEDDLTGGTIGKTEEFFWALEDGQGQGIRKRYYTLTGPPIPDRIKTLGWIVYLRRIDAAGEACPIDEDDE